MSFFSPESQTEVKNWTKPVKRIFVDSSWSEQIQQDLFKLFWTWQTSRNYSKLHSFLQRLWRRCKGCCYKESSIFKKKVTSQNKILRNIEEKTAIRDQKFSTRERESSCKNYHQIQSITLFFPFSSSRVQEQTCLTFAYISPLSSRLWYIRNPIK